MAQLELYDRRGQLIRAIAAARDEHDETKWHLAEAVSFDDRQVESAVLRFIDGTSQVVSPSVFPTSVPINTLFITPGL